MSLVKSPLFRSKVTVVIPTKNRKDSLRRTLRSVYSQSIDCEVICLDDGSSDGTADMLRLEFPRVRLIRYETSQGPAACRNQGAKLATSDFLLTLDDDCVIAANDSIAIAANWLDCPDIGAVTMPFVDMPKGDGPNTAAPASAGVFVTSNYNAGMVMFRRSVFLSIDGYRAAYFMHHEEADLAARLMNAGWLVRSGSGILIYHHESPIRDHRRLWLLGARNSILYAFYNVPGRILGLHLLATIINTVIYASKSGGLWFVIKGFEEAVPLCWRHWKDRRPISWRAYRVIRSLRRRGPQPIGQVKAMLAHA